MTVAELMSVLEEMDPTDLVVIGLTSAASGHANKIVPAADDVYKAAHQFTRGGEWHSCVVIEA